MIIYLFMLSSCSGISFNQLKLITESLYDDNRISGNKLYSQKYSHLVINGRDISAIFILENRLNNVDRWIGPNGDKIYTLDGFVIKTELFGDDYFLSDHQDGRKPILNSIEDLFNQNLSVNYVENNLYNYKVIFDSLSTSENKKCPSGKSFKRLIPDFNTRDSVKICYNSEGIPISSKQNLEPYSRYEITYNYLFN